MPAVSSAIGFLGAGKMASALAKGWLNAGLVAADRLSASDPLPPTRAAFAADTGAFVSADNQDIVRRSDVLILAVKPQNMAGLLADIKPVVQDKNLIVSIAAGISLAQLTAGLGGGRRLIRVMPNTPCQVGASASAYVAAATATAEDVRLIDQLLNSVGKAMPVQEHLLDAVTGLSGSGPAYVAVMIEALSDGGVRAGLPRGLADMLAAQTVFGTAKMLLEMGMHTGQLKDMVASPGGTTIAGLHALERGGLRAALMDAVEAATKRSMELGK